MLTDAPKLYRHTLYIFYTGMTIWGCMLLGVYALG